MLQRISIPPTTASDWWCTKAIADAAKRDANNLHRDSQWTPRSMRPGILTWRSFQFSNVRLVISEPQKRGTFRYVICRQKSKGVTPKTQNPRKLHTFSSCINSTNLCNLFIYNSPLQEISSPRPQRQCQKHEMHPQQMTHTKQEPKYHPRQPSGNAQEPCQMRQ